MPLSHVAAAALAWTGSVLAFAFAVGLMLEKSEEDLGLKAMSAITLTFSGFVLALLGVKLL